MTPTDIHLEFLFHFVKTAENLYDNEGTEMSWKWKVASLATAGAAGGGTLLSGQPPDSGAKFAKTFVEKIGKKYTERAGKKNTQKTESLINDGSSRNEIEFCEKLRQYFLRLGYHVLHSYEYQLSQIYLLVKGHPNKLQGVRALGEFGGGIAYLQCLKYGGQLEEEQLFSKIFAEFSKKPSNFMKTWVKERWASWEAYGLYFDGDEKNQIFPPEFFYLPIPAFSSNCGNVGNLLEEFSKDLSPETGSKYLWFHSKEYSAINDETKKQFAKTRLRRPFEFEKTLFIENMKIKTNHKNVFRIDALDAINKFSISKFSEDHLDPIFRELNPLWQSDGEASRKNSEQILQNVSNLTAKVDHHHEELKNEIKMISLRPSCIPPSRCCIPPAPIGGYIDRADIFEKLEKKFEISRRRQTHPNESIIVLTGDGGKGKTQASRKFASTWKGPKFWIGAENFPNLRQSFVDLAKSLHIIPSKMKQEDVDEMKESDVSEQVQAIFAHLSDLDENSLFILDNAEGLQSIGKVFGIFPFLPKSQLKLNPAVLITSRMCEWGSSNEEKLETFVIPDFTPEESRTFVHAGLGITDHKIKEELDPEIILLHKMLQGRPLALRIAVGFINQELGKCRSVTRIKKEIESYRNLPPDELLKVDDTRRMVDYDLILNSLWDHSYQKIKNSVLPKMPNAGQLALKFLEQMAYLHPENINVAEVIGLFEYSNALEKQLDNKKATPDLYRTHAERHFVDSMKLHVPKEVSKSLKLLEIYSMVEIEQNEEDGMRPDSNINVHRLVQLWMRQKPQENPENLIQLAWANLTRRPKYCGNSVSNIYQVLKRLEWPKGTIEPMLYSAIVDDGLDHVVHDVYMFLFPKVKALASSGKESDDTVLKEMLTFAQLNILLQRRGRSENIWKMAPSVTTHYKDILNTEDALAGKSVQELRHWILDQIIGRDTWMSIWMSIWMERWAWEFNLCDDLLCLDVQDIKQLDQEILDKLFEWITSRQDWFWDELYEWLLVVCGDTWGAERFSKFWASFRTYALFRCGLREPSAQITRILIKFLLVAYEKGFSQISQVCETFVSKMAPVSGCWCWSPWCTHAALHRFDLLRDFIRELVNREQEMMGVIWDLDLWGNQGMVQKVIGSIPMHLTSITADTEMGKFAETYGFDRVMKNVCGILELVKLPQYVDLLAQNQDSRRVVMETLAQTDEIIQRLYRFVKDNDQIASPKPLVSKKTQQIYDSLCRELRTRIDGATYKWRLYVHV